MTDIAPVKGLIELTDNFTSQIGLAGAALSNFSKQNQESLKAVAGAAGFVTAAIGAIAFATIELGKRGSDVNDINQTLEHFAGGANAAKAALDGLREGTQHTVDDFALAKDAAHLLSAGVQLTAADFKTLGDAAFVLQNRGFGGTKEQLDLVSEALVTGRTRTLAATLGVIAADDAQEAYAKSLGVTVDKLSDAGKAEANRLEVMRILAAATKDAGEQTRDFGEEFEFAQAQLVNFVDDLSSAIASSKVFEAGFKAVEAAVASAFSGDKSQAIDTVVHFIEDGAIKVLDFAQGAISMARVVEGAWSVVRVAILGTETTIVGLIDIVVEGIAQVANAASALHIISPETAQSVIDLRTNLRAMTVSLKEQTDEAGKAVFGHTEFDKTLDGLSESLAGVRNAMSAAKDSTKDQTEAAEKSSEAAKKNAASQAELNAKMIDQNKVNTQVIKSTNELAGIWDNYFKLVAAHSGTTRDAQIADIEATFNKQIESLDALDPLYAAKYQAYRAIADESLKGIEADWDSVRDNSIEGLQEQADKALATYELMITSGLHFRREVLDGALQKYHELSDKARGWGDSVKAATDVATDSIKILDAAWITDADIAAATISKTTVMVRTLSGELVSLAEAQKRQQQGGSFDVTKENFSESINLLLNGNTQGVGVTNKQQIYDPADLASKGYSFAEITRYAFDAAYRNSLPPAQGPRIPGFAEGGSGDFGAGTVALLHGKEHIITDPELKAMFDALNNEQAALWRAAGGKVDNAQLEITRRMDAIQAQYSGNIYMPSVGGRTGIGDGDSVAYINITSHDAEHTAQLVEDRIIRNGKKVRKFGSAVR